MGRKYYRGMKTPLYESRWRRDAYIEQPICPHCKSNLSNEFDVHVGIIFVNGYPDACPNSGKKYNEYEFESVSCIKFGPPYKYWKEIKEDTDNHKEKGRKQHGKGQGQNKKRTLFHSQG